MNRWRRLHLCSLTLLCLALAPASHAQPALQEGAEFYLSGPCHFVDPAPAATWALVNLISLNEESRLTCRNMNGRDGATGESTEIAKFRVEKVGDDNQYKLSANGKFLRRGPPTADSNTHNTVLADVTGDDEAPWFRVSPNYGYNVVRVWADLWRGVQFDPGAYAWKQGRDSGSGDLVSFPGDLTYHFRIHFPSDAVLWRDDVAKVPSKVLNVAGRLLVVKYSSKGFLYRYVKEIAAADPPTSTTTGYTFEDETKRVPLPEGYAPANMPFEVIANRRDLYLFYVPQDNDTIHVQKLTVHEGTLERALELRQVGTKVDGGDTLAVWDYLDSSDTPFYQAPRALPDVTIQADSGPFFVTLTSTVDPDVSRWNLFVKQLGSSAVDYHSILKQNNSWKPFSVVQDGSSKPLNHVIPTRDAAHPDTVLYDTILPAIHKRLDLSLLEVGGINGLTYASRDTRPDGAVIKRGVRLLLAGFGAPDPSRRAGEIADAQGLHLYSFPVFGNGTILTPSAGQHVVDGSAIATTPDHYSRSSTFATSGVTLTESAEGYLRIHTIETVDPSDPYPRLDLFDPAGQTFVEGTEHLGAMSAGYFSSGDHYNYGKRYYTHDNVFPVRFPPQLVEFPVLTAEPPKNKDNCGSMYRWIVLESDHGLVLDQEKDLGTLVARYFGDVTLDQNLVGYIEGPPPFHRNNWADPDQEYANSALATYSKTSSTAWGVSESQTNSVLGQFAGQLSVVRVELDTEWSFTGEVSFESETSTELQMHSINSGRYARYDTCYQPGQTGYAQVASLTAPFYGIYLASDRDRAFVSHWVDRAKSSLALRPLAFQMDTSYTRLGDLQTYVKDDLLDIKQEILTSKKRREAFYQGLGVAHDTGVHEDQMKALSNRNLRNEYTYHYTQGLTGKEQTESTTFTLSCAGNFSMSAIGGASYDKDEGISKVELTVMAGYGFDWTFERSKTNSQEIGVSVEFAGDLGKIVEPALWGDRQVQSYSFETYLLEPSRANSRHFYDHVVDKRWLASEQWEAQQFRQMRLVPGRPWRVVHRVTSRLWGSGLLHTPPDSVPSESNDPITRAEWDSRSDLGPGAVVATPAPEAKAGFIPVTASRSHIQTRQQDWERKHKLDPGKP